MMRKDWSKPKFNKRKCLTCIYKSTRIAECYKTTIHNKPISIVCDYISITKNSCLINTPNGIYDMRGEDYNNCKLYRGVE